MGAPTTIQEARKQQQLDRVARKGKIKTASDATGYCEWFGNQPAQVAKKDQENEHLAALNAVNKAGVALGIAEITGVGLEDAKHDYAVAVLVAERKKPGRRDVSSSLSAVGS